MDEETSLTHVDPEELALFSRGDLAPAESRRVRAHLARCVICRRALEPGLPRSAKSLSPTAPNRPSRRPGPTALRQAFVRADERAQAASLRFEDLRPAEFDRLGGFARVELLLAASHAQRYTSPTEMLRLAELAVCESRLLRARRYGRQPLADLRARCWAELGNAFRVADDLAAAEDYLKHAARWTHRGTSAVAARLTDLTASLWADQGRYTDAVEALERLATLHEDAEDTHLAGRTWIKRGIFLGQDNQPRRAILSLETGLSLIDPQRDPALQLSGMHTLVKMLVDADRPREARRLLLQIQRLHHEDGSPLNLTRLRWLWGRIHSDLGDLNRAERELQAARAGFGEAEKPYDQALVSLDLAQVYVRQHRRAEAQQLAAEMFDTFRCLGIAREILAVLLLTRERCEDSYVAAEELCRNFREIAILITELDRARPRHRRLGG